MLVEPAASTQTVIRELSADLETPISVYMKLRGSAPSFLLEFVEGGERIARYSFIGVQPRAQYILRAGQVEIKDKDGTRFVQYSGDPTHFLQEEMSRHQFASQPGMPRFIGGLVGYLGYEAVRFFEPTLQPKMMRGQIPDGLYLLADTILAFDHAKRSLSLIANVLDGDMDAAQRKLDEIEARLHQPLPPVEKRDIHSSKTRSNMTQGRFEDMVRDAREYIVAGDIFQVVLSQRFTHETEVEPFDVYRAVRRLNPSPYMFFFDFGVVDDEPLFIVGSSPEMFVRLEGRTASLRPIAGTRPRGPDAAADAALAQELLADPKERAEHVMLVDLGRNDLGRVCEYGTVKRLRLFHHRKIFACHAHRLARGGQAAPRADRLRPGPRSLPRRDRQRRAQGSCTGDHLRARAGGPRRLCRHDRLLWLRRQHGYLPCDPYDGWTRPHIHGPGWCRHRG